MTTAAYRDRITGAYPIPLAVVRQNADALFGDEPTPDVLDAQNLDPVAATEPPAYDPASYTIAEGDPWSVNGQWHQTWTLTPIPPAPVAPVVVFPADLWRRTTDAEAEAIEAAMAGQSARLRNLFRSAQTYQSDDPLWPVLNGAATELFGAERAAELLAPS